MGIGGLWLAFLLSGVHATIAGVLAAFTIPATTAIDERGFIEKLRLLKEKFINTELAFSNQELILQAKLGILIASLIGGATGYSVLRYAK